MEKQNASSHKSDLLDLKKEALLTRLLRLEDESARFQAQLISEEEKNLRLEARIVELTAYLCQARQHRFGRKSEKTLNASAPILPGLEQVFDEAAPEDDTKSTAPSSKPKRKASGGRKPLPSNIPREEVSHDLAEHEKICSCGHRLHCIGKETSEQLEVIPAKVKVLKHVRWKYGCKSCEETVILASMPRQPIPKSMAAPGLLSHILVSKYDDHLPLYRQAEIWERTGIDLDRGTLGRWVMKCGDLLEPLVDLLRKDLLSSGYIQADETTVQVFGERGRKNTSKSYMWVYKTGGNDKFKIIYDYSPERSATVASDFLGDFKGYLQSDGYSGYKKVCKDSKGSVKNLCCWAHARRKFVEIAKISTKVGVSTQAIEKIASLYGVEKKARESELNFDEVKTLRGKESQPILDDLKKFLEKHQGLAPPKSTLGEAIGYTLRRWKELNVYLEDGSLSIDNNEVERCIRPFAVGLRNWLFKGSVKGAEASAVIYYLLESAKSYGLNPFDYFEDILKKIPLGEKLENLLPYNWKQPADKA